MHNSPKGTNLSVGNPENYDELIIIIGPRSRLRKEDVNYSFHVYRFTANEVKTLMRRKSGHHYCAKGVLHTRYHDSIKL